MIVSCMSLIVQDPSIIPEISLYYTFLYFNNKQSQKRIERSSVPDPYRGYRPGTRGLDIHLG